MSLSYKLNIRFLEIYCIDVYSQKQLFIMATKQKRVTINASPKLFHSTAFEGEKEVANGINSNKLGTGSGSFNNRKLVRRSSMICSEGFDKYTYDCHSDDIPRRSAGLELDADNAIQNTNNDTSDAVQAADLSDDQKCSLIKRDSVVHPGKLDVQRSVCVNNRFQNPWPTWHPPTVTNILKFGLSKDKSNVPSKQVLDLVLPLVRPNFTRYAKPPEDGIRITWIGHSTVFVQMHGLNVLTDPIFSDRASPSQVVGPKRYRDPPCSIHDLPHIDAVVISHSHYDHLDFNTVRLLNARFDTDIRWFVPAGLLDWMHQVGCENVVELDWWEENCVPEHSDTCFVFTPAQHWSKRTITDDNKVLWGSWCIIGPKYRFFFAGDTGYCEAFKQIGKVYGPFDVSAIPIGAYEPRWFMKYQHVNPEESVKIHMDVRSKYSLAIHWGTFCLANEYYLDPPRKLRDSLDQYNIASERFFTMKHGETRLVTNDIPIREKVTPIFGKT